MAEYNARIKHKRDTDVNWADADPVLLNGEIIIVDTMDGHVRKKVGDGTQRYSHLPFDDEQLAGVVQSLTNAQKEQARANIGAGQPVFAVNLTATLDDNYTADKTAAEIEAAYQAGRTIVCRMVVPFVFNYIPAELPLKSRVQERVFIFALDQLVKKEIYTLTVQISDSGVEPSMGITDFYEKPTSGIPKSDLADDVQTSLTKADSALQSVPDTYRTAEAQNIIDATKQTKTIADAGGYFGANPTVEGALQQLGANSGGGSGNPNAVLYIEQTLTNEQKAQARSNINAEEAGTSYTKSEVDTKLDEKINASNGKFTNSLSATTTDGVILLQNEMRVGVLSTGCVNISKTQINFYNKSGHLGLSVDASTIRNLETPSDDRDAANKEYVDTAKTEAQQLGLTAATPGQIIKVKAVQDGKPTEWEAVDDRLPKVSASDAGNVLGVEQIGEFEYGYVLTHMPTLSDFIPLGITNASPGQFAKVSFVDDFGNPTAWEAADIYEKPDTGIPKSDLEQSVQTSLNLASTALQAVPGTYRTAAAQDELDTAKQPKAITDVGGHFGENPTVESALQQLGGALILRTWTN